MFQGIIRLRFVVRSDDEQRLHNNNDCKLLRVNSAVNNPLPEVPAGMKKLYETEKRKVSSSAKAEQNSKCIINISNSFLYNSKQLMPFWIWVDYRVKHSTVILKFPLVKLCNRLLKINGRQEFSNFVLNFNACLCKTYNTHFRKLTPLLVQSKRCRNVEDHVYKITDLTLLLTMAFLIFSLVRYRTPSNWNRKTTFPRTNIFESIQFAFSKL